MKAEELELLKRYFPEASVEKVGEIFTQRRFKLHFKRPRSSKLGDFRPPRAQKGICTITLNLDLNPYQMLITYLHEVAHYDVYQQHGSRSVQPHGTEWQKQFSVLLQPFMTETIFPKDVLLALEKHLKHIKASSTADQNLQRVLQQYDKNTIAVTTVESLPNGAKFTLKTASFFKKARSNALAINAFARATAVGTSWQPWPKPKWCRFLRKSTIKLFNNKHFLIFAPKIKLMTKKVFVSGCYDLLHSGHVEFFRQAAQFGDLYVGIGSDKTILHYKKHKTLYPEKERLFMVKAIRYVKDAFINDGDGVMDFVNTVDRLRPDIFVVNEDGASEEKRQFCEKRGIEYVVLQRTPSEGLEARSSTVLKQDLCQIPTRLDLAGTWIDQPYVSCFAPGWAITISLEPTFKVRERCGLSTSTRNMIKKIWPIRLPDMDPEILAKLVFCFENDPERRDGIISGAQDSIGICMPGLVRHYYDKLYWPVKIESCQNESILSWLECHLVIIPMEPRRQGCSVIEGKDITEPKVKALAKAADDCWNAIMNKDLNAFAAAYKASFNAQTAMFPAMIQGSVQSYINKYSALDDVLAWKMPGAGGGGYLACVVNNAVVFNKTHPEAITLKIRRK